MPLAINKFLNGRYRIEALVGEGGMGVVYRAFDILYEETCALKEFQLGYLPLGDGTHLHAEMDGTRLHKADLGSYPNHEKAAEQFLREAKLLVKLDHPNLPKVYDYFETDGNYFLVMTLIEGKNLADIIEEGDGKPLLLDQGLHWFRQIMETLGYCHSQGVVHRDVKPANVIITPEGRACLVDFGIAKSIGLGDKTIIGARATTPGYSAPEQYGQAGTNVRSDIYSLGALLYALFTGRDPLEAVDRMSGLDMPDVETINPGIYPRLSAMIQKAMSLSTADRFQTIVEMQDALRVACQKDERLEGEVARKQIRKTETPVYKRKDRAKSPIILGIDFGTSRSSAAIMDDGIPVLIPSSVGSPFIPSMIALDKDHKLLVGSLANDQAVLNAQNTIFSIKTCMGRKYSDPEIKEIENLLPYRLAQASNGDLRIILGGREYSTEEIAAIVLKQLKTNAEAYLGEPVLEAVIAVPGMFNEIQNKAVRDAGRIAGFESVTLRKAAIASGMAYALHHSSDGPFAVINVGAGTFDISILSIREGVYEVLSTQGETFLGGDNFDQRIMNYLIQEFQQERQTDLKLDPQGLLRLRQAAEKARIELSTLMQTEVNLPYLAIDASGPQHLAISLSRVKLEQLTNDLIKRMIWFVKKAMNDSNLDPAAINKVILTGGMTRMPAVEEAVKTAIGNRSSAGQNPEEGIAIGAGILAGILAGTVKDCLPLDAVPLTLGVCTKNNVMTVIFPRNTIIPVRRTQTFTVDSSGQVSMNLHLLQGEHKTLTENISLGHLQVHGIPQALQGKANFDVVFDIDANGILNINAWDHDTQVQLKADWILYSGLSKTEVEQFRMESHQPFG